MRKNLLHIWYKKLSYEIREIVEIANKIEHYWKEIFWENIWDPIEKWEHVPDWMKHIVTEALKEDKTYAYSPSKWLLETRRYLSKNNPKIWVEDIIFFNWLWEAINKTYGYLDLPVRVLWPNPAYPTHSSAEATNSWSDHLTYSLIPENDWNPNLEEIENKVKYNPNVVAILVINPDNPTWIVFKKEILEWIVDIARRYDLFVIFDEIYEKLTFDKKDKVLLADIIGDIPWISMKWISKELPWPWARCGWIEVYNQDKDENFRNYINSIFWSKMLEVCSTTLPQYILPQIYEHPNFKPYLEERIEKYKSRAELANKILWDIDSIIFIKPKGAFYLSVVFKLDKMKLDFTLEVENKDISNYLKSLISKDIRFDRKFCYSLLSETWICLVPLSWFNSIYDWFRMTLLEEDIEKFKFILSTIKDFIKKVEF